MQPLSPIQSHSISSIADSMLEMSSPERRLLSMKRYREDSTGVDLSGLDSNSSSNYRGSSGTALKRSHTLATIRESPGPATTGYSHVGDRSGQIPPQHGHGLRRSMSEGKTVPSHPPRPPVALSGSSSSRIQGGYGVGEKQGYGRINVYVRHDLLILFC
jgi:hypothetical protein